MTSKNGWNTEKVMVELSGQDLDWLQTGLSKWDYERRESPETVKEIDGLYQRLGAKLEECGFDE